MNRLTVLACFIHISEAVTFGTPAVHQLTEPIDHAEGPIWDCRTGLLYFVDIFEGRVLSYDYVTNELNAVRLYGNTTPVIPSHKDPHLFIVGVERSLLAIRWDGKGQIEAKKNLTTVSQQFPTSRINDGKADPMGRVWFGTMGYEGPAGVTPNEGVLYLASKHSLNNPVPVIHPVNISNGMAWNRQLNKFYYIDTLTFTVREFDYNIRNGNISNPRVVFNVTAHKNLGGFPDGMTIDKDDNLWIALYYGGAVVKVNPTTGCVLQVVAIPAQCVSSVAWGGPNLDVLFVTTSRHALSAADKLMQPAAGSVFAVTNLDTRGLQASYANIIDNIDSD